MSEGTPAEKGSNRRKFLKVAGAGMAAFAGYALLDSLGVLGPEFPIRNYIDRSALTNEASKFGEDGDRVAYAANYLGLGPDTVSRVIESWNSTSHSVREFVGNDIPTATAAVVADELSNPSTMSLAQQYPNLLWVHAHTNALFAFPFVPYVSQVDQRLVKLGDLRLSEGPATVQGQSLDLHYPENDPSNQMYYGKKRYVREGFEFFAGVSGTNLENMDPQTISIVTEQSTAISVTIQDEGSMGQYSVKPGDTFIFFDTPEVPLYCFTAADNRVAIGPVAQEGALSVGLNTMSQFRSRHPGLADACGVSLSDQGYVQLDGIENQDQGLSQYLYGGFYKGLFSINPIEKTISWKQYQSVGLVPEQTVRGLGVAKILDFNPAWMQPLSLLKVDAPIVELLVQSPEVYVPSRWNAGSLFRPYDENEGC
jgi:hypothetical protein